MAESRFRRAPGRGEDNEIPPTSFEEVRRGVSRGLRGDAGAFSRWPVACPQHKGHIEERTKEVRGLRRANEVGCSPNFFGAVRNKRAVAGLLLRYKLSGGQLHEKQGNFANGFAE